MTTFFTAKFLRDKMPFLAALISLTVWVHPQALVLASANETLEQNQLVFEVKNLNSNSQSYTEGLQLIEVAENDPLVNNLRIYLQKHNSPLAPYAPEIIKQAYWQKALAISWVESNFGKFCFDNNCSGIGVKPGHPSWRKYENKFEWFEDLNAVLAKPIYSEKFTTCRKMKGVYVQPGTENWVKGCEKKYNELIKLTAESENQRQMIAQKQATKLALETFPDNSGIE